MPLPRRYRGPLIFAVVFVVMFIHFVTSHDWEIVLPGEDHDHRPHSPPPVDLFSQRPHSLSVLPGPPPQQHPNKQSHKNANQVDQVGVKTSGDGDGQAQNAGPGGSGLRKPHKQGKQKQALGMFPVKKAPPHWKRVPELFPLAPEERIKLPTGQPKPLPKLQANFKVGSGEEKEKLHAIRKTFEYAWNGYKATAMGKDELKPLRGGFRDTFNGWGATVVDALDTLWVMGLKEEFALAVEHVKKIDFTTSERLDLPVFETVIRYMGGLLGAYDISKQEYPVLLEKAVQLAEIVMGAFDTPNRMPTLFYQWTPGKASKVHHASRRAVLAEIGSLSMEFTRLAQLTKNDKYYDAIARITNELGRFQSSTKIPGLWPTKLDATGCEKPVPPHAGHPVERNIQSPSNSSSTPVLTPSARPAPTDTESYTRYFERRDESGLAQDAQPAYYNKMVKEKHPEVHIVPEKSDCQGALITQNFYKDAFGLGAEADSTYEYLPKEYMLLGGLNDQYRSMYEKAMDAARRHLLFRPMVKHGRDIRFLATLDLGKPLAELQPNQIPTKYEATHLTCFAGGMFAVGSKLFGIDGDMDIAAKLTDGCVWAYESTYTGIMPETFLVVPCKKGEPCTWDETRYKNALDPRREERLATLQKIKEQAIEAKDPEDEVEPDEPVATPQNNAVIYERNGNKRDASQTAQAPTPTASRVNITRRSLLSSLPGDPASALADDYVKARVKDERLPPGVVRITDRRYLLRPEAIESVFIMYRLTGDNYWREKGWRMFEGIAKHTRTGYAHSAIEDVTSMQPEFQDSMESFWLSETLKYFYLLFSDPSVVSLDEYVLNTEAHPLRRPT